MTQNSDNDPLSTGGAFGVLADLKDDPDDPLAGRTLGTYEIISLLAAGGMGRVYRARRADGSLDREVAVKISATSGLSDELRSRFAQEQNVLAGLNHPNICQLYDAQVSDEGWPYIVMELVDGDSIVEYCRKNELGLRQRLRLLVSVVDAVAYAHSQLVVHRDIKPANVLVNSNEEVKLLDFGIAKLLEADVALTQGAPLTPRYASPEQLLGQPITVASDIAQLGLLIYEVLSGEPLNSSETLAGAIQRAADGRSLRIELDKAREMPREVLPIIEHCLRADPRDRYSDANSLKADLEAYLNGYPVSAVGQSTGYRLRKLVSRNWPTAITAMVAITAIISGVAWYTWQLTIAREVAEQQAAAAKLETEKSDQIIQFLITLFDAPDPQYALGEDVTVRQVLESGIEKVRSELDGQEALKADLLLTLGRVFNELGELEKGGKLVEEAVEIHRGINATDTTHFATAVFTYAQYFLHIGDLPLALSKFEEALEIAKATPTDKSLELQTNIMNSLGIALSRLNRFEQSESVYREAIAIRSELFGPTHLETSVPQANLALLLAKLGRYEDALPLLESSYRIAVAELGPYHPWIAPRAINLGHAYQEFGRNVEAEELLRVALDQDRHIYGETHQYVASSLQNLGILIFNEKERTEGVQLVEQGLAIEEQSIGKEHIDTNQTRTLLASYYTKLRRYDEAEALLDKAQVVLGSTLDDDHIYLANLVKYRGQLYLATERPELAVSELTSSAAMFERLFDSDSERLPDVLFSLADAYSTIGENESAVSAYSRGLSILENAGDATDEHYKRLEVLKRASGRLLN